MSFTDSNISVPAELRTDAFVLRPIVADDAELDFAALMETREYLRLWEQSSWPEDDFTVEANRADLVGLEERHAAHRAFTYTVLDPNGTQSL
ncbi:MAG TPA: N-acetyltransferase, partial [Microbacteriaceae bacterium]|nr:N-acetyltransferase [Microbacteriaceae bacterium]